MSPRWAHRLTSLALSALLLPNAALAATQAPGSIVEVGETLVSAMMMFLGNEEKVYMLDKVERNPTQFGGHSAWASEWDIGGNQARPMSVITNPFCSSGMHFPNGSFATFGGNGAIGPGGNLWPNATTGSTGTGFFDPTYLDYDGEPAVRILNPCTNEQCEWYDNSTTLQRRRWYSTAEPLANGTILIFGGFTNGGYINRNYPNVDRGVPNKGAEYTFETYPPYPNFQPPVVPFIVNTSGLNAYAHLFLLPSGKMFAQANYSTMIWDYNANTETALPDMPGQVARVYPASGGVAMLPLTPENSYNPTIIFCGGIFLTDFEWGNYSWPFTDTWKVPASDDCQRITPEPLDGSLPDYEQDDPMIGSGRTMGQFIILPDATLLMINGAANGTAGYSTQTLTTPLYGDMPFGMSLSAGPALKPAIYNPRAPKGSRWSDAGLGSSTIPRLYHSSAILLPDASVLVAGSNPNVDYNVSTIFSTEYRAERFYPWYFGYTRPVPSSPLPTTLTYGGTGFDVSFGQESYSGSANEAAANSSVVLMRPGFTTHAMNMGQRHLQLNNTYTVSDNGTITLHVSQVPPNPNILQPGPVLVFLVVNGIPSNGTMAIVGSGLIQTQPQSAVAILPPSVNTTVNASGNGGAPSSGGSGAKTDSSTSHLGTYIGIAAGGAVVLLALAGLGFIFMRRRSSRARAEKDAAGYGGLSSTNGGRLGGAGGVSPPTRPYADDASGRTSDAFIPLRPYAAGPGNDSTWDVANASSTNLVPGGGGGRRGDRDGDGTSVPYTPYSDQEYTVVDDYYSTHARR